MTILLVTSYISDLVFGDPEWLPHPARLMGKLISSLDNLLKRRNDVWIDRIKGAILSITVIGSSALISYALLKFSMKANPYLGAVIWVYLAYTTISVRDLHVKTGAVYKGLASGSLERARRELAKIVGRDTKDLDKDRVARAAIESIAESTNDGIIAPLFYLFLGGPVLAIAYKAVSTLDSMIGYKNEKYTHVGWFSAKLDDAANYVPARIAGFLIALSSFFCGKDAVRSFKVLVRDGRKHPSPNSGLPEAAMAGALGIRLGGASYYGGELHEKPYIGGDEKPMEISFINEAMLISFISSLIMLSSGVIIRWLI